MAGRRWGHASIGEQVWAGNGGDGQGKQKKKKEVQSVRGKERRGGQMAALTSGADGAQVTGGCVVKGGLWSDSLREKGSGSSKFQGFFFLTRLGSYQLGVKWVFKAPKSCIIVVKVCQTRHGHESK